MFVRMCVRMYMYMHMLWNQPVNPCVAKSNSQEHTEALNPEP